MRHDLEYSRDPCPQWGQGDVQNVESNQPQHSNGERILCLGNGPVLQRAAGGSYVVPEVQCQVPEYCGDLGNFTALVGKQYLRA